MEPTINSIASHRAAADNAPNANQKTTEEKHIETLQGQLKLQQNHLDHLLAEKAKQDLEEGEALA